MKQSKLFESFTVGNMTIKNRIVMSPMCMYSCQDKTGKVNDWHHVHYTSRAVGQVGLIMVEATAVTPTGRISEHDLGIWSDEHVEGLAQLVENVHAHGAKIAIQLAHAGRKANTQEPALAPSPIPFHKEDKTPLEMSLEHIDETVEAFGDAARRAKEAGFDGVEIHAAHGYLINEFLSPLSNRRADEYGGDLPNRYRFLGRVIQAVKNNWDGPIWARISANEYDPNGNSVDDMVQFSRMMQADGVDLIDCSSGGVVPVPIRSYPGYQVPYAEAIRRATGLPTGAVGLITEPEQAEEIVQNERADVVFLGRELLRNPYWPRMAAARLGVEIDAPAQYLRAW